MVYGVKINFIVDVALERDENSGGKNLFVQRRFVDLLYIITMIDAEVEYLSGV